MTARRFRENPGAFEPQTGEEYEQATRDAAEARHYLTARKPEEFKGHTPGPWRIAEGSGLTEIGDATHWSGHVEMDSDESWRGHIAFVQSCCHLRDGTTNGETEANARLIAAAPALLAERDALAAEVARLREALARITAIAARAACDNNQDGSDYQLGRAAGTEACAHVARAALAQGGER